MTNVQPKYRYRGSVVPSADVSRPAAARKNTKQGDTSAPSTATLDIFDVVDSYGGWWGISAGSVDRALKTIGDVDTLYVRVNSPGGEAMEGVAIANLLRSHKANVRVTVYGIAASAASVIAIAGDTVAMAPGSMIMIHDAWNLAMGSADDMRTEADSLDAVSDSYASLYALKAGGTAEDWRAVMRGEKWYTAAAAKTAGLADVIGVDPELPDGQPPVVEGVDVPAVTDADDIGMAAAALAQRFDLSMFAHAPAALADPTKTPADQPVTPPTEHKEAVTMTDTIPTAGLAKALGLADDADEDTILEAVEAKITAAAAKVEPPKGGTIDVKAVAAALQADGKVVVSQAKLDALTAQAAEGAQARAKQIGDERNELIEAAMSAGKISRSDVTREVWAKEFARDFDAAKADLESLPARFPVGDAPGVPGNQNDASAEWSDDEADMLAGLAGLPKGALR